MAQRHRLRVAAWQVAGLAFLCLPGARGMARAQTTTEFHVIKSFVPAPDGMHPNAGVIRASDGLLYGTTTDGGAYGLGTIFRIEADGKIRTLHSFAPAGSGEGVHPRAGLVQARDGGFFGTTSEGGAGFGSIFRLRVTETDPVPTTDFATIYNFDFNTLHCYAGLTQGPEGDDFLYGTTASGLSHVFKLDVNGENFRIIHDFAPDHDGVYPMTRLIWSNGFFYGTTSGGGDADYGTVFKIDAEGTVFEALYSFTLADGGQPASALIPANDEPGTFYGTTSSPSVAADGIVFKLDPAATPKIRPVHTFSASDGTFPVGDLTQGSDGSLYGLMFGPYNGVWSAFRLGPDTGAGRTLKTLVSFGFTYHGPVYPIGLMQAPTGGGVFGDGSLYGTTAYDGDPGIGTVFKLVPTSSDLDADWTFSAVHTFCYVEGGWPNTGVVSNGLDGFYGTTSYGGAPGSHKGHGTIFGISPTGVVTGPLDSFAYADGSSPSGLTFAWDGHVYGTTMVGGANFAGTVFKLDANGKIVPLHSLTTDEGFVVNDVMLASDGRLYGTTNFGGLAATGGTGTAFSVDTSGGSSTTFHSFIFAEGVTPYAGVIQGRDGYFYGTTSGYGPAGPSGFGTVFRIDGTGTLTVLHAFDGTDGNYSLGPLIQASDGSFYGTTIWGGILSGGNYGIGVVFKLRVTETGAGPVTSYEVVHRFTPTGEEGFFPTRLIQASDGHIYGTTLSGGAYGNTGAGTVFRLNPDGSVTILVDLFAPEQDFGGSDAGAVLTQIPTLDGSISFYGTTHYGGDANAGTVFRLTVPRLIRISVTPDSTTLAKDHTRQFTATGTYDDGTTQDLTAGAAWTSSDPTKATIAEGGLATGVDGGNGVIITATFGAVSGTASLTVTGADERQTPTITWTSPGDIVFGTVLDATQLNAIASTPGSLVYTPLAGAMPSGGAGQTLHVDFTPADTHAYTTASADVTINVLRAGSTVSATGGTFPYDHASHPATGSAHGIGGALLGDAVVFSYVGTGTTSYGPTPTAPVDTGTYKATVSFPGNQNYLPSETTAPIVITQASTTMTLGALATTYDGRPKAVTVQVNAGGELVSPGDFTVTYGGIQTPPTDVGSYAIKAVLTNRNFAAPDVTGELVIARQPVTIRFTPATLIASYDGTSKTVSATAQGAALEDVSGISVAYDGLAAAPIDAGHYAVVASLSNPNYTALNAVDTLVINPGPVQLTLGTLRFTYDGTPKVTTVTARAGPTLSVITLTGITTTYDGLSTAPTNAGNNYHVVAHLAHPNYVALDAAGTLVIDKAVASLTLGSATFTYDGTPKPVAATVSPAGLSVIAITYNGASVPPTDAGSYPLHATLTNQNYTADATGTLLIKRATPGVTVAGGTFSFDNFPHPATGVAYGIGGTLDTLSPPVTFSYVGTGTTNYPATASAPINAGTYQVTGSFAGNSNYTSASNTAALTINPSVVPLALVSIAITPGDVHVTVGKTQQFTARGTYSNGSTADVTASVTWSSSRLPDATIDATGMATGLRSSLTVIRAKLGSIDDLAILRVGNLHSISVTAPSSALITGQTLQFTAMGTYDDGTTLDLSSSVTWSFRNAVRGPGCHAAVAIDAAGLVTGVGSGECLIVARSGSVSDSAGLTVGAVSSITLKGKANMIAGTAIQFSANGQVGDFRTVGRNDVDITDMVAWSSSNALTATVSGTGLVTGVGESTTTITAKWPGSTVSDSQNVKVWTVKSIAITPANPAAIEGTRLQLIATASTAGRSGRAAGPGPSPPVKVDITNLVEWSSSSPQVTVDATGLATCLAPGDVTISASWRRESDSVLLQVVRLNSITVAQVAAVPPVRTADGKVDAAMIVGSTLQFIATGHGTDPNARSKTSRGMSTDLTKLVGWSSQNVSLATIDGTGLAAGIAPGTTRIQATLGTVVSSTGLEVVNVGKIDISGSGSAWLVPGDTMQLVARTVPDLHSNTRQDITGLVTWVSDHPSVARIDSDGLMTAFGAGTVTITARIGSAVSNRVTLVVLSR